MVLTFPFIVAGILACGLFYIWNKKIGWKRAVLASALRVAWVTPLLLSLTSQKVAKELPRASEIQNLHVLIDDTESMGNKQSRSTNLYKATQIVEKLKAECASKSCRIKEERISNLDKRVGEGYSPLNQVLAPFLLKTMEEPWIFISDGGDMMPGVPWDESLRGLGAALNKNKEPRGIVLAMGKENQENIWISGTRVSPFLFESKPGFVSVQINRAMKLEKELIVQVQVLLSGDPLTTVNGEFLEGDESIALEIPIPSLPKGQHLLTIKVLPLAEESSIWDNQVFKQVEVLPDTVGVLHLLGAPSWDGRFVRRYLKSEPKYDRISFFILRDPWDSQLVSEREMSLIPFPVERLFNEELPNFRVLVLQNFSLFQFLEPSYQKNLVEFVKNGGGLLFMGGERALLDGDLQKSPLREILPFTIDQSKIGAPSRSALGFQFGLPRQTSIKQNKNGPYYDANEEFEISLAEPDPLSRSFASVYEDWLEIWPQLELANPLSGIHFMKNVQFKQKNVTPLLNAKTKSGETFPFAVASYPEKGRALWFFSDSLWQIAMSPDGELSRKTYHEFLHTSLRWLLKNDFQKPLIISDFILLGQERSELKFEATFQGPATRYFESNDQWKIQVCGLSLPNDRVSFERSSSEQIKIKGSLKIGAYAGKRCELLVEGNHPAFGEVKASLFSVFPERLKDDEVGSAPQLLEKLTSLTQAKFIDKNYTSSVQEWLLNTLDNQGIDLPVRKKFEDDYFWVFRRWYFWVLMMALPFEILVRRWHQLF